MSLLGKLFARGLEGVDNVSVRPGRKFTRKDLIDIADRGASQFRADAMNLLSCYELEGEFGLYSTLGNFTDEESDDR